MDGIDLYEILTNPAVGQYKKENVVHLQSPTKKELQKHLKRFAKRCRKVRSTTKGRVTIIVFLAGHTGQIRGGRTAGDFFLCADCKPTSNKKLTQGAVRIKDIMKTVTKLNPKSCIFFLHGNHATERLLGIKSIAILLDKDGEKYSHLNDKDRLTIKGIQHNIDCDILKWIVTSKKNRRLIPTNTKQLDKMAGTYVSDLDNDKDDEDDEDDEEENMFVHAAATNQQRKQKRRKKKGPTSNILCVTSCMAGQTSRYGDAEHGVQPRNSVFGLHLCAAFCGRTIHQETMERVRIKRRKDGRKTIIEQEEREEREREERENEATGSATMTTTVKRPELPSRFQDTGETDEVFVDFNNQIQYMNRYSRQDAEDANIRGMRADILIGGLRQQVKTYSNLLEKRRRGKVEQEKLLAMKSSRDALDDARSVVQECKQKLEKNLEELVKARIGVTESQNALKEKKKESSELAQEAGILSSKAHSAEEMLEAKKADDDTNVALQEVQELQESLEKAKTYLGEVRDLISDLGIQLKTTELESRDLEKILNDLIQQQAIDEQIEIRRRRSPTADTASWLQTLFIRSNGGRVSFVCSRYPKIPSVPPRPAIHDEEVYPKSLSLTWNMGLWDGAVIDEYVFFFF